MSYPFEIKLDDELEVTNLLLKIKNSNCIFRNIITKRDKKLLSFNKDRVIDI